MSEDFGLYAQAIKYSHISTGGTHVIRDGPIFLHRIQINTPAGGTITLYNNGAASGDVIGVFTGTAFTVLPLRYGINLDTGLTLSLSTAMDITVVYE
jgi:hypothetical protein